MNTKNVISVITNFSPWQILATIVIRNSVQGSMSFEAKNNSLGLPLSITAFGRQFACRFGASLIYLAILEFSEPSILKKHTFNSQVLHCKVQFHTKNKFLSVSRMSKQRVLVAE